jgi:hypothetical protein
VIEGIVDPDGIMSWVGDEEGLAWTGWGEDMGPAIAERDDVTVV